MKNAHNEFRALTDPLTVWLNNNCVFQLDGIFENAGAELKVRKDELLAKYNEDCRKNRRPEIRINALTTSLKHSHPEVTIAERVYGLLKPRCFIGMGLKK